MLIYQILYILILLSVIYFDYKHYIIPDYITLPGIAVFLAYNFVINRPLPEIGLSILLSGGLFLLIALIMGKRLKKEALGGGDIKLITLIGLYKGWYIVLAIILISSITAIIYAGILHFLKKKNIKEKIAYGFYIGICGIIVEVVMMLTV